MARGELGVARARRPPYRERVDLVGAALLERVVIPRPPRHGSFLCFALLLPSLGSAAKRDEQAAAAAV
jgi:hypothetical protein